MARSRSSDKRIGKGFFSFLFLPLLSFVLYRLLLALFDRIIIFISISKDFQLWLLLLLLLMPLIDWGLTLSNHWHSWLLLRSLVRTESSLAMREKLMKYRRSEKTVDNLGREALIDCSWSSHQVAMLEGGKGAWGCSPLAPLPGQEAERWKFSLFFSSIRSCQPLASHN